MLSIISYVFREELLGIGFRFKVRVGFGKESYRILLSLKRNYIMISLKFIYFLLMHARETKQYLQILKNTTLIICIIKKKHSKTLKFKT